MKSQLLGIAKKFGLEDKEHRFKKLLCLLAPSGKKSGMLNKLREIESRTRHQILSMDTVDFLSTFFSWNNLSPYEEQLKMVPTEDEKILLWEIVLHYFEEDHPTFLERLAIARFFKTREERYGMWCLELKKKDHYLVSISELKTETLRATRKGIETLQRLKNFTYKKSITTFPKVVIDYLLAIDPRTLFQPARVEEYMDLIEDHKKLRLT